MSPNLQFESSVLGSLSIVSGSKELIMLDNLNSRACGLSDLCDFCLLAYEMCAALNGQYGLIDWIVWIASLDRGAHHTVGIEFPT
jgi:hypothetical protein